MLAKKSWQKKTHIVLRWWYPWAERGHLPEGAVIYSSHPTLFNPWTQTYKLNMNIMKKTKDVSLYLLHPLRSVWWWQAWCRWGWWSGRWRAWRSRRARALSSQRAHLGCRVRPGHHLHSHSHSPGKIMEAGSPGKCRSRSTGWLWVGTRDLLLVRKTDKSFTIPAPYPAVVLVANQNPTLCNGGLWRRGELLICTVLNLSPFRRWREVPVRSSRTDLGWWWREISLHVVQNRAAWRVIIQSRRERGRALGFGGFVVEFKTFTLFFLI